MVRMVNINVHPSTWHYLLYIHVLLREDHFPFCARQGSLAPVGAAWLPVPPQCMTEGASPQRHPRTFTMLPRYGSRTVRAMALVANARASVAACAGRVARPAPARPIATDTNTDGHSASSSAASAAAVAASSSAPFAAASSLSHSIRIVVREMRESEVSRSSSLDPPPHHHGLDSFTSILRSGDKSLPRPSVVERLPRPSGGTQRSSPAQRSSTAPRQSVIGWLRKHFGFEITAQADALLLSLEQQARRDDWLHVGIVNPSVQSRVQLDALHLWLIHVRLRSESESTDVSSHKFIRVLFDRFWSEQRAFMSGESDGVSHVPANMSLKQAMRQLVEIIYGGWIAMDHALLPLMQQRQLEEQITSARDTAASGAFESPRFSSDAADLPMLGALWRNTFLSDRDLDPAHLTQMVDYIVRTLEHLYRYSARDIVSSKFEWVDPPLPLDVHTNMTPQRLRALDKYYDQLAKPVVQGDELRRK